MLTIEPHVSKYIDSSIERAMKRFKMESKHDSRALLREFNENSKQHMSVVLEDFKNSLKAFKEVAPKIPTEERIREIIHEEIHPLDTKLNVCLAEIHEHRKELDRHEERISSLELDAV